MLKNTTQKSAVADKDADECRDIVRPGLAARLRSSEVRAVKQRLRERFPQPTLRQLQRARQPLYDCMHRELLEDDHPETAAYLLELIEAELRRQDAVGEGVRLHQLWQVPDQLERLMAACKLAERSTVARPTAAQPALVDELLQLGLEFAGDLHDGQVPDGKVPAYRWVAESVLLRALLEARKILTYHSEMVARVQYHVGMLYMATAKYEQANEHLTDGRHLANGHQWLVSRTVNELLHTAVSKLLCASLTATARNLKLSDPMRARKLCDDALQVAESLNSIDAMAGTLTSYGRLLMDMQRFVLARDMFERCVEQRRGDQDLRNLCRSELQLADCLFVMAELEASLRHGRRAHTIAADNGFRVELAEAYASMATCERALGTNRWGASNYAKAVQLFGELGEVQKTRRARCYAAIAVARSLIGPFAETARKADKEPAGTECGYAARLLAWRSERLPFWEINPTHPSGFGGSFGGENDRLVGAKAVSTSDTTYSAYDEVAVAETTATTLNDTVEGENIECWAEWAS